MKRVTLEKQLKDEIQRIIFEKGISAIDDGASSKGNTPEWDNLKETIAKNARTFGASFFYALPRMILFYTVMAILIIWYMCG